MVEMPQLINLIKEITTDMPRLLTDQRDIYIKSRNITPGVNAKIVDEGDLLGAGWHRLACVQDIQIHACEADWTPEGEIESLQEDGLLEDLDNIELLQEVVTVKEASQLTGKPEDTIRSACEHNLILSRKAADTTHLMLREDVVARWGKL